MEFALEVVGMEFAGHGVCSMQEACHGLRGMGSPAGPLAGPV